jgi:penicillin-insensitive murein endopeptidase
MILRILAPAILALHLAPPALAQDKGTIDPKPLPPLANPNDPKLAAKELFGRKLTPAHLQTRAIGFYAKGCIAGAKALPINGETWQVMRLSRNRMYGHAELIALLERLANKVPTISNWPGLLVGDISQARGGPMLTGHASHQVGLDADVWLTPMPKRELTRRDREEMSATDVVAENRRDVDPKVWTRDHVAVIKAAAEEPAVERIFVNAAIKKALCRDAGNHDRAWLSKVRPMYGHNYHFHIRMRCPAGSGGCTPQKPPNNGEGCSAGDLAYWFSDAVLNPKPSKKPPKPKPPITLAQLPPACKQVLLAP